MTIRTVPLVPLNSGRSIPQLGLGTWPLRGDALAELVVAATERGYRHIDTARRYENEDGVGEGIRRSGLDRGELFITTKLDGEHQGDDRAIEGLAGSLERLGVGYVDLLLIHWPLPARDEYVSTWRTFERLVSDGLVRSIGTSNFLPEHLDRLAAETGTVPAVNQIQLSPYIQRTSLAAYDSEHGIVTESWSPLGGEGASVLDDPELQRIAAAHGATAGQVTIAWHLAKGYVVIPKTATPARLGENLDALDLDLTPDDLAAIDALDRPGTGVDPNTTGH